jgi:GNAT superfamily N-acetyltransferase
MRRVLDGGFELDDDPARIDLDAVTAFLTESYWAKGRTRDEQQRLNQDSARLVGLYRGAEQIGFARVSYWEARNIAFLNDVYVLDEHRGRGLGLELVRETVDGGRHADALWLLRTEDMHRLYAKLGFAAPDEAWMVRPHGANVSPSKPDRP